MKIALVVAIVVGLSLFFALTGIQYETARGMHTGYITAVMESGIIFKTGTAYIKTDVSSSQEDSYCFMDDSVGMQLKEYATSKEHVNVYFFSWLSAGIKNCAGENQIIYFVEPIAS